MFGAAYEETRYSESLAACALDADVAALPAGDMTELGERGINLSGDFATSFASAAQAHATVHCRALPCLCSLASLLCSFGALLRIMQISPLRLQLLAFWHWKHAPQNVHMALPGGQKARLALARAAYSGAEIQLLDDPLSAVDPRVGRTLFDKCLGPGGIMQARTLPPPSFPACAGQIVGIARLSALHAVPCLPRCRLRAPTLPRMIGCFSPPSQILFSAVLPPVLLSHACRAARACWCRSATRAAAANP